MSTTVTATQTIGIPSALCFYTTNELSAGPALLAFWCVMAYRPDIILLVFFASCIRDRHPSGPTHHPLFILYYEAWNFFFSHIFDLKYKLFQLYFVGIFVIG